MKELYLTILGNQGPFPGPGGGCSSYLIEAEGHTVLCDCGTGAVRALQEAGKLGKIEAVLLSHLHFDHISDLFMMQYALKPEQLPMDVYAPSKPEAVWDFLCQQTAFRMHDVLDTGVVELDGLCVRVAPGVHPVPSVGYRFGDILVYSGDTNESESIEALAKGCGTLLCDCGVDEPVWTPQKPHLSPERAGKLAAACGVRRMILTHFAPAQDVENAVSAARSFAEGICVEASVRGKTYSLTEGCL